jgi:uncharacterized SAM-binding protein YcdF (DUF218 family)
MDTLKSLFLPPGIFVLLFAAAFLVMRKRGDARSWIGAAALVLFYGASTPYVGGNLLRTLEQFPAADARQLRHEGVGAILVLAAGVKRYAPEYGGGLTADTLLLERLRYASWLSHATGLPVFVSGGLVRGRDERVADVMAKVLREDFGIEVAGEDIESSTTYENGLWSAKVLKDHGIEKVALVTHAWHMPRAVLSLQAAGIQVVPAPTAFTEPIGLIPEQLLPSMRGLSRTYYALYEWLGIGWYRLTKFSRIPG